MGVAWWVVCDCVVAGGWKGSIDQPISCLANWVNGHLDRSRDSATDTVCLLEGLYLQRLVT